MASAPSITTDAPDSRLQGHLRLPGAVALAITIVVGSGALVLPGTTYAAVGPAALYAWGSAAVLTIPLLVLFARLGAAHPGAGGAAGFVQAAFGRHLAGGVEVLLMGTFGLGIPAIALTGGNYLASVPALHGLPASAGGGILLLLAAGVVTGGVRLSSRVQLVLAIVLTAALLAVGALALAHSDPLHHLPPLQAAAISRGVMASGSVFFAFTGWEMLSFTTEEYANPRRDFPRAVTLSFIIVVVMYLLLAWGVQNVLPRASHGALAAPIQALAAATVSSAAAELIAVLGVVLIVANLVGAVWGASRLVMSSAREGLLPGRLARLGGSGQPRRAVLACAVGFLAVIGLNQFGWLSLAGLLTVAGQNFFLLYLLCALAYTRLFRGGHRLFGIVVSAVLAAVALAAFGPGQLAYAAALVALGTGLSRARMRVDKHR